MLLQGYFCKTHVNESTYICTTSISRSSCSLLMITNYQVIQLASEDDLSLEEMVVVDLTFCNSVVGGPTSTLLKSTGWIVDLAGDVTIGVSSLAELAGDVTVGVSSPADLAGNVTVGVSFPADLAVEVSPSVRHPRPLLRWRPRPTFWGGVYGRPCWICHCWCGIFSHC